MNKQRDRQALRIPFARALAPLADVNVADSWQRLTNVVDGSAPELATHFRGVTTTSSLVFDFVASASLVTTRHRERNGPLYEDDVLEVFLQPPGRRNSSVRYLELEVSPAGILFDAWVLNRTDLKAPSAERDLELTFNQPGEQRPTAEVLLDGVSPQTIDWSAFTQGLEVREWKARLTIPWRALDLGALPDAVSQNQEWRGNVTRVQRSATDPTEYSAWCPTGRVDFHRPECFGAFVLER